MGVFDNSDVGAGVDGGADVLCGRLRTTQAISAIRIAAAIITNISGHGLLRLLVNTTCE